MPRFVRVGDKANIAASLINLSDKAVAGTVRMELFNPETEKVFYTQKQKFGVKAGETGNVSFTFDVTDKYTVLACRMVAEGDTFSDGEQRYIPVLTDKQWVTESVPLDVNGKGSYTFSLEHLFNNHSRTASGRKMTVEFTSNPVWYAVMHCRWLRFRRERMRCHGLLLIMRMRWPSSCEFNPRIKQILTVGWHREH